MTDIPNNLCRLNYPIKTPEAEAMWGSRHKCNRMKSIIAFSLTLENANDNLRRYGYTLQWRKKAIRAFGKYVNQPTMKGIPFSPISTPWWECMPVAGGGSDPTPPPGGVKKWTPNYRGGAYTEFPIFTNGDVSCEVIFRENKCVIFNNSPTDPDVYIATNEGGALYWSGFDEVKVNGTAVSQNHALALNTKYTISGTLSSDKALTKIGGYPSFDLHASVINILLLSADGSDTRRYTSIIESEDQPRVTELVDSESGKNATLSYFPMGIWTVYNDTALKLWDDLDLWNDDEDWIETLIKIDESKILGDGLLKTEYL